MGIPANIRIKDCIGKYATTEREIQNGAGQVIPKGSTVKIVGTGRSLHIKTEPCRVCGQHCYVRDINKSSLTLTELTDKDNIPAPKVEGDNLAVWLDERYDDEVDVWRAECSACNWDSDEVYGRVSLTHKFCENCGARMKAGE